VRTGDEAAFESLFRAYAGPLYAFAYSYVGSQATAQEIVQDLFARMWERRETLEVPRSVYAYLFSATRNRAISHLRNRRVEHAFLARALQAERLGGAPSGAPQERELDAQALAEALDRAVRELPPRCREVFALTRDKQLSYAQVAEVLHISPKTVQIHMGRALALLRQKLGPWLHR
jgi:RNA polymerase sigma-70 factor (ECF subfamily)